MSSEAIVRLASRSKADAPLDQIREQMETALNLVEKDERLRDRSFSIQTPKGTVLAVGRRYGAAYVDRYIGRDEEERAPLERSIPGEDTEARRDHIRQAARAFVDTEKTQPPQTKPRKRRDQEHL